MVRLREFTLMEDDLLPAIEFNVTNDDGTAVNLTGATVLFVMATRPEAIEDVSVNVISAGAATIVDPLTGHLKYQWVTGNTTTRGKYIALFEITIGTRKFSVPNDDYLYVRILSRLPPVVP